MMKSSPTTNNSITTPTTTNNIQNGHHDFHALKSNLNIQRYALMRDEIIQSFKFSSRNLKNTFIILGLIPLGLCYIAVTDSHKWDLRGKRKDQSILKYPLPINNNTTPDSEE